jgi:L-galactose dehydrogenase/L-glyceraldehyde 3-phosphate reductase
MEQRRLGATGLRVSALGFGCGNVGGLVVRGTRAERERAIGRALGLGITYFDTAPSYGDGLSEQHLGQALRTLGADPVVGTKFSLPDKTSNVEPAIRRSLEASLVRLGRETVDILHLHDAITSADHVVDEIAPVFERLRGEGKIRFGGITCTGATGALHRVVHHGGLGAAQVFFNLLNPSAAYEVAGGFPAQDFERLIPHVGEHGTGVIVVRALAGGALSAEPRRHPMAAPQVDPISTGPDYATDLRRAELFRPLVQDNLTGSLVEASLRFPLATEAVSTVLLGVSSLEQLELAAAAVEKGTLPDDALDRLHSIWNQMAEER